MSSHFWHENFIGFFTYVRDIVIGVMLVMLNFCTVHIRSLDRHKIDVIYNNVHRNERKLVTL